MKIRLSSSAIARLNELLRLHRPDALPFQGREVEITMNSGNGRCRCCGAMVGDETASSWLIPPTGSFPDGFHLSQFIYHDVFRSPAMWLCGECLLRILGHSIAERIEEALRGGDLVDERRARKSSTIT